MNYDVRVGRITEVLPPLRDDHQIHDHVFDKTGVAWVMDLRTPLRFCACGVRDPLRVHDWTDRIRVLR